MTERRPRTSPAVNPPSADAPKKTKTDLAIEAAIKELVAKAPPLTAEMKARLADIFSLARRYKS